MTSPMTPAARVPQGKPNWGTGVQPARRTTAEINAEQYQANQSARGTPTTPAYAPRNLGTLTSAGLNRPGSYPLGFNVRPRLSSTPDIGRSWGQPNGRGGQNLGTLTSEDLVRSGSNYNTYPGGTAAARAYRPPQQTERANPLTGDNNFPMEGQTTPVARAPFVQRGAGIPQGQDAAPVQQPLNQDEDIGSSMQGTMDRLRGASATPARSPYARRFGASSQQSTYDRLLSRIMQG